MELTKKWSLSDGISLDWQETEKFISKAENDLPWRPSFTDMELPANKSSLDMATVGQHLKHALRRIPLIKGGASISRRLKPRPLSMSNEIYLKNPPNPFPSSLLHSALHVCWRDSAMHSSKSQIFFNVLKVPLHDKLSVWPDDLLWSPETNGVLILALHCNSTLNRYFCPHTSSLFGISRLNG